MQDLQTVRNDLLRLHKLLLDDAKRHYERLNGPVPSPSAFLDLLVNDPFFAWLRVLSQLVVMLDEGMEAKTPLTTETGFSLIRARLIERAPEEHVAMDDALARLPEAKELYDEISSRVS